MVCLDCNILAFSRDMTAVKMEAQAPTKTVLFAQQINLEEYIFSDIARFISRDFFFFRNFFLRVPIIAVRNIKCLNYSNLAVFQFKDNSLEEESSLELMLLDSSRTCT